MKFSSVLTCIALVGTIVILSSCSPRLTPFTQKLYEKNDWSESDLKKIQFYLSEDIILRREVTKGGSKIESGSIKVVNGSKVEEIKIKKGTPGVLTFIPKEDRFAVAFEGGNDERYLMFGPNPKYGNRYALLASNWKRRGGEVTYDGTKFYTTSESAYASLLVNLKKIKKVSVKSRTAGGRKID